MPGAALPYVLPYSLLAPDGASGRPLEDRVQKTSVYLPERLKLALADRARATGRSEAEVLRAAVEREVAADQAPVGAARLEPPVPGRLVGVGTGPGEADLLTLRAVTALRRADRVIAPATAIDAVGRAEAIVRQALPGLRVERVAFDMAPGRADRDQAIEAVAQRVLTCLTAGEEVAWVTLGDPLVYSTWSSIAHAVRRHRPTTVIEQVPGIMAFQALAARTGTVVADERTRLVVRTALGGEDLACGLDDPDLTTVVYKGGRHLPALAAAARQAGRPAVAGELIGMPGERVTDLDALAAAGPASYLATVIIPARNHHFPPDANGTPRP
jgi:precorrin-2/cobalt-factor-2 C20-methyltransferase